MLQNLEPSNRGRKGKNGNLKAEKARRDSKEDNFEIKGHSLRGREGIAHALDNHHYYRFLLSPSSHFTKAGKVNVKPVEKRFPHLE